jgi:hypothetical protein
MTFKCGQNSAVPLYQFCTLVFADAPQAAKYTSTMRVTAARRDCLAAIRTHTLT